MSNESNEDDVDRNNSFTKPRQSFIKQKKLSTTHEDEEMEHGRARTPSPDPVNDIHKLLEIDEDGVPKLNLDNFSTLSTNFASRKCFCKQ